MSTEIPINLDAHDLPNFVPPITDGRVIKIYDGDTFTLATRVPGMSNSPIYKFSVRLAGIDTPEIKGKTDDEKEIALGARDALSSRIFGKMVVLKNVSLDKYGRILADVFELSTYDLFHDKALTINQWMIEKRWAIPYDGGTKLAPKSWRTYHETGSVE